MTILDTTLGALFDGVAVSTMLYGVTCAQTFVYFLNDFDDDGYLKLLVLLVWMVRITASFAIFESLITGRADGHLTTSINNTQCSGKPLNCGAAYWSILVQVVPGEICAVVVECYFVLKLRRCYPVYTGFWCISSLKALRSIEISATVPGRLSVFNGLETPVFTTDTRFRVRIAHLSRALPSDPTSLLSELQLSSVHAMPCQT
ncbi:hypothetical protein NEOLEDRAFT_1144428 [Neolentinus lepideus HHB14362 ss-1]|uniref:Uncharacterized protein n=1 Tax=Neolentinus lepideus HHB14362 ss-1 TaxID=1314782 RepID=A0A165WAT5_9AGAM|nr:hypothetical protein NEOLEDRAFT_1144428 [Neolentinus lepideus HHB14362 ss-1]